MTFIDVSANIGLYKLFAARRVTETGCVVAIEPSSREIAILRNGIERNVLKNVMPFPAGLSIMPRKSSCWWQPCGTPDTICWVRSATICPSTIER